MTRVIFFIGIIGIILGAAFMFVPGITTDTALAFDFPVDAVTRHRILEATLRITLIAPALDEVGNPKILEVNGEKQRELNVGEGLGTVVRAGGEIVIVTHDHWSLLSDNLYKVQFHTPSNALLLELDGATFWSLIRYRDGGTLIFVAPDQVATRRTAVELAGGDGVPQKGDALLAAYWQPAATALVSVEPVVVEVAELYQNVPSMKMKSVNGKAVTYGNSGGGVFLSDGRLVGNMWLTVIGRHLVDGEYTGVTSQSSLSRATQLTFDWPS